MLWRAEMGNILFVGMSPPWPAGVGCHMNSAYRMSSARHMPQLQDVLHELISLTQLVSAAPKLQGSLSPSQAGSTTSKAAGGSLPAAPIVGGNM